MARNVLWSAHDAGFIIHVRHGIRVVQKFKADAIFADSFATVRIQAAAKAVELALEHRIELAEVREACEPL